jgi:hypothetical protein
MTPVSYSVSTAFGKRFLSSASTGLVPGLSRWSHALELPEIKSQVSNLKSQTSSKTKIQMIQTGPVPNRIVLNFLEL